MTSDKSLSLSEPQFSVQSEELDVTILEGQSGPDILAPNSSSFCVGLLLRMEVGGRSLRWEPGEHCVPLLQEHTSQGFPLILQDIGWTGLDVWQQAVLAYMWEQCLNFRPDKHITLLVVRVLYAFSFLCSRSYTKYVIHIVLFISHKNSLRWLLYMCL